MRLASVNCLDHENEPDLYYMVNSGNEVVHYYVKSVGGKFPGMWRHAFVYPVNATKPKKQNPKLAPNNVIVVLGTPGLYKKTCHKVGDVIVGMAYKSTYQPVARKTADNFIREMER